MRLLALYFISFYQRFVSPIKGFHCAHHAVHGLETCSNAVAGLIREQGLWRALPQIKQRFAECRDAYDAIKMGDCTNQQADIPCDLPCDISFGDCGSGPKVDKACDCLSACDWPFERRHYSKRTRRLFFLVTSLALLIVGYVYHGRDINAIHIVDHGADEQGIIAQLVLRDKPAIRAVAFFNNQKIYSNIVQLNAENKKEKLIWAAPIPNFKIDRLELHDARLDIANEKIVIGQVLESFDEPLPEGQGQRFSYRIKRRWHF